jgi:hypothetical protein
MELCPPGTLDPTFTLLDTSLYVAASSYALGMLMFNLVRPVDAAMMSGGGAAAARGGAGAATAGGSSIISSSSSRGSDNSSSR